MDNVLSFALYLFYLLSTRPPFVSPWDIPHGESFDEMQISHISNDNIAGVSNSDPGLSILPTHEDRINWLPSFVVATVFDMLLFCILLYICYRFRTVLSSMCRDMPNILMMQRPFRMVIEYRFETNGEIDNSVTLTVMESAHQVDSTKGKHRQEATAGCSLELGINANQDESCRVQVSGDD